MPALHTLRISHPALIASNIEETIRFYTEVLGMELVLRQPNLDDPDSVHLFFGAGGDTFVAFFGPADARVGAAYPPGRVGVGSMQHLAFDVTPDDFEPFQERLRAHGVAFSGPIDRGYERSVYFRDPNGIILELLTWITPPPPDLPQADIIAQAHRLREEAGDHHIEDRHVQAAVQALRQRTADARG